MKKNKTLQQESIKQYIKNLLNDNLINFELPIGGQQRTVADLIESKISEILYNDTNELISEKKLARSKKSIEDITLISNGIKYYIDPKTHDINSQFSMPNLTSIEKIKKLFLTNKKELVYVFVTYSLVNHMIIIGDIKVFFIWELDMSTLGVGALGKGQLQIKNANIDIVFTNNGKIEWYSNFKKLVQDHLIKQITKINKQILEWQ